jgi:hypothetical protein
MSRKPAKDKKKDAKPAAPDGAIRLASHPRASASVRRLRARAGLAALVIGLLLSLNAGLPLFDAVARGLVAGIAAHFLAWFAGLLVWRHLVLGELAAHREAVVAARAERLAAAEQARAASVSGDEAPGRGSAAQRAA